MSISSIATKVTYSGNNSTVTPYTIPFKYLEDSHVNVYIDGVLQVEGAGQNYALAGDGTAGTGTFTTTVAQAGTKSVVAVLDVELDQPVSLQETGSLPAKTLEQAYDRLNMQIRRVWRKAQDVLTFSSDEGGTGSTGTADNLLGFDGSGDLAEIPNTTFAQTANDLSDLNDAATARTNLNVDVAGTDNSTDVTKAGTGTYVSLVGQALTINKITAGDLNSESATVGQVLQSDGDTTCSFVDLIGGGNAQTANPLSQFAATTSAELAGVISDETGTGALVFATSPTLVTPALGTPSAVDLTNATNTPLPAADSITYDMVQDVTAADKILGSVAGGTVSEITCTSAGRALLDDADASAQRTTLGLAIGTDVQAYSSTLDDIVTLPSVTGTATFTNSTNNIALTGIGSITGLADGDVIEVTGSVSNDDVYTVEGITDTGNVIVNAEHAGGTTSKSLTDETVAVTVTLVCKAKNAPLGYGQGWVAVTRSANSDITNSTGRLIAVGASATNSRATYVVCSGYVDGLAITNFRNDDLNNYDRELFAYFNVTDGSIYKVETIGCDLQTWSELR